MQFIFTIMFLKYLPTQDQFLTGDALPQLQGHLAVHGDVFGVHDFRENGVLADLVERGQEGTEQLARTKGYPAKHQ
jgi:hypothetical protein